MHRLDLLTNHLEVRMAIAVLSEIEALGMDSVRVSNIAERLEMGIGKLYRTWGHRTALFEHAWRVCVSELDHEIQRCVRMVTEDADSIDALWDGLWHGLPTQVNGFFELHTARRRWNRSDHDSDATVLPSLLTFIELGQRFRHFRDDAPARVLATLVWAVMTSWAAGTGKHDEHRGNWCCAALKRLLLAPERLAQHEAVTVKVPTPDSH